MQLHNSHTRYGAVTKTFHWLTALLILSLIPLGHYANDLAYQIKSADAAVEPGLVERTAFLFSVHKTLGVSVFFVALLRILWALGQRKPGLLNGDHRAEAWAAETVHWLLYGSLVLVPLSGWVHHAATTGFAPIWWPFGQNLPFVPKDEALAETAATLHFLFQLILTAAVILHIAGALKHHVIDRDATLRRMLPGAVEGQPTKRQPGHFLPALAAVAVWGAVLVGASSLGWFSHSEQNVTSDTSSEAPQGEGNWIVQDGTLGLTVIQLGSEVSGQFSDWSADITYDETPDADGLYGAVTVSVAIPSLSLGSVTDQAKGSAYLDAANFPQAVFDAELRQDGAQMQAVGTLTIKDQSVPVTLPFDLTLDGDTAKAAGKVEVNRLDFGIGEPTEGSVAFAVTIGFDLTATRGTAQ